MAQTPASAGRFEGSFDDDDAVRPARKPVASPARRTVTITGRGSERRELAEWQARSRRRPAKRPHERAGTRPDRIAMWAVLMGVLLVLVAATSSHAAIRAAHHGASHATIALRSAGGHVSAAALARAPRAHR